MDILYVVGNGSQWQDNELRFSLRSIARYGINVGRVYLVGNKPSFVGDAVTYIPCDDPYDCAHKNILHKVLYAIEHSDISSHFLISSDDHFYIKYTDFDKLPVYFRNLTIQDGVPFDKRTNPYNHSLVETRGLLEKNGLPIYQTNPHCNTHFDVEVYRKNKALFDECFKLPHGGELNCVMGNLLIQAGAEPVFFHDSKVGNRFCTPSAFADRVQDANCVSGVPRMGGSYLAHWLIRHFQNKCIFEK